MTPDLFGETPPHNGTPTSIKAARRQMHSGKPMSDREKILEYLRACGVNGATDREIQMALHVSGDTERPRRNELLDENLIQDSGRTRKGIGFGESTVWIIKREE